MSRLVCDAILALSLFAVGTSLSFASNQSLVLAVIRGSVTDLRALLADGLDVNAANSDGLTALHYAVALRRDRALIKVLLNAGANVHQKNGNGWSPLAMAKEAGYTELVQVMQGPSGASNTWIAYAVGRRPPDLGTEFRRFVWGMAWNGSSRERVIEAAKNACQRRGGRECSTRAYVLPRGCIMVGSYRVPRTVTEPAHLRYFATRGATERDVRREFSIYCGTCSIEALHCSG